MALQNELTAMKEANLARFDEQTKNTVINDMMELAASGIVERAPHTGDTLANFELPNAQGTRTSLAELTAKGPVVVTFYRGGWCPYCNLELRAYQAILPELQAAGATLVAITPELPDESMNTSEKNALEFEVLTDQNSEYAQEIGIAFTVNETIRPIYEGFGINLEKHNGEGQFLVPLAATFVVDTNGVIVCDVVEADYTVRADPQDVLTVVKSLQK